MGLEIWIYWLILHSVMTPSCNSFGRETQNLHPDGREYRSYNSSTAAKADYDKNEHFNTDVKHDYDIIENSTVGHLLQDRKNIK